MTEKPETLSDLLTEINAINERAKASGRELLGKAFAAFFDRCPEVYAVVWTQYAPYFNDGDPCVFSVREPEVRAYDEETDGDGPESVSYGHGGDCMINRYRANDTPVQQRVRAAWDEILAPAFTDAAESIMQSVFGDDCKVVATRDGFHVAEYSHD